ncbi:hypothetical protein ACWGRV_18405 [Streptomyces sp. NPDC055663]
MIVPKHYRVSNGGWFPAGAPDSLGVHGFNAIARGTLPMETLIDDMDLRHDGCVDVLPFCFDAGGNLFMLVLDAERYGCIDLCFADGWTQEPTGLDAEEFFQPATIAASKLHSRMVELGLRTAPAPHQPPHRHQSRCGGCLAAPRHEFPGPSDPRRDGRGQQPIAAEHLGSDPRLTFEATDTDTWLDPCSGPPPAPGTSTAAQECTNA